MSSIRRTFGRGIVTTRTALHLRDDVLVVPVALLLAGLPERTERRLSLL